MADTVTVQAGPRDVVLPGRTSGLEARMTALGG